MKEKKLSNKTIVNTLNKRGFIEIYPICDECAMKIIMLVIQNFSSPHIDVFTIEDEIYCLRISV